MIVFDIVAMSAVTVLFMFVLQAFATRMLGVRISSGRLLLAGAMGLGAQLGFESQFVWGKAEYTPALIPVQVGIVFIVAIAFLVIADLLVPPGSMSRPDRWIPLLRARVERARRYAQLTRIAMRSGLIPFRPATEATLAAAAERSRQGKHSAVR